MTLTNGRDVWGFGGLETEMAEVTLDLLGKRLDELQGEAAHYRLVFDVILKEVRELTSRMDTLASRMILLDNRMDRVEARVDKLEVRMEGLEVRMEGLEARMESLEARMDGLEAKVDALEERIMARFDTLEQLLRGKLE